jgi:hypothetical protein
MDAVRLALPLALLAALVLAPLPSARAEIPEPGLREQEWALAAARRHFEGRRYEQALSQFESAERDGAPALPPDTLRQWGIAASETGWPLAAWVRLRQYLAAVPAAPDRSELEGRAARARNALVALAPRRSRLVATSDRRDFDEPPERRIVRLVARDGRATIEALAQADRSAAPWERAGELALDTYLRLVARLLDAPAIAANFPVQVFDPNEVGPRRAVALRIVMGEEERRIQALRGTPYDEIRALVADVLEFARTAPLVDDETD